MLIIVVAIVGNTGTCHKQIQRNEKKLVGFHHITSDLLPKYEFPLMMICGVLQIYSYFWQRCHCPPFNSLGTGGLGGGWRDLPKNTKFTLKSGKSEKEKREQGSKDM